MNSRVSWSNEGIDPAVRERAEAAARRAGVSLNDWLNLNLGDATPPNFRNPSHQQPAMPTKQSRDVTDIHERLDAITRQIEQISQGKSRNDMAHHDAARNSEPPVAKQTERRHRPPRCAAVADFEIPRRHASARLRKNSARPRWSSAPRRQVYRPSPPLNPGSFDSAIAEISARQNELDSFAAPPTVRSAPPIAPAPAYAPPPAAAYAPPPPPPGPRLLLA